MRGFGGGEALRALLPDALFPLFALITQLGDTWFVFLILTVLYWVSSSLGLSRRRAAFVLALSLGSLALIGALKQLFALPRPPMVGVAGVQYVPAVFSGLYIETATASGYGFPSGHALTSTLVWGGLAIVLDVWTRRRRALAAGTIITLVCFSRVALGVHYVVDVVAGVAVGIVYLAVLVGLADGRTRIAFWVAAAIAVASVFIATVTFYDASTLGATVGAAVTWELLGERLSTPHNRRTGVLTTAIGLAVFGGGFVAVYALKPPFVVAALASAVILAGVLSLPLIVERVEKRFAALTTD